MGVYINMEMPKDCTECWFRKTARHEYLSDCQICPFSGKTTPYTKREDDCPLVPVPPHGRLGDLDELAKRIERERFHHSHTDGLAARHHVAEYGHFLNAISEAPTVIPASKEE